MFYDLRGGGVRGDAGYPLSVGTPPPRDLYFLVVAFFAGNRLQKGMIVGGLQALQTVRLRNPEPVEGHTTKPPAWRGTA